MYYYATCSIYSKVVSFVICGQSMILALFVLCLVALAHCYCPDYPAGQTCFTTRTEMASRATSTISSNPTASVVTISKTDWEYFWMNYSDPEIRLMYGDKGSDLVFKCYLSGSNLMTADSMKKTCSCFGSYYLTNILCDTLRNKDLGYRME